MDENKKPFWDDEVTSANDKDLQKGHTYIGKEGEYVATNGSTIHLNSDKSWDYVMQPSNEVPYLQSVDAFQDAIRGNMAGLKLAEGVAEFSAAVAVPAGEVSVGFGGISKWVSRLFSSGTDDVVKGGSSLLRPSELARIENAATRINKPINVVGSRANGTAKATSDWDYVIEGLSNKQWKQIKNSLPGAPSRIDNLPRMIDIFKGTVDPTKPYIKIYPKGIL